MSLFLNLAYALLLLAVSPVLIYRSITQGKYRNGWGAKLLGRLPEFPEVSAGRERYWFHAVSVGEVLLLESILPKLQARVPDAEIVLSTTTSTGHAVAREKFPDVTVCYFPLDFSWSVKNAIARIQPTRIVLVELELWPNFLQAAQQSGIPVSLVNGRLSEKSFRGYSRIRWLIGPLLRSFDTLAVQNEIYAKRFANLGANPEQIRITGSAKFDRIQIDRLQTLTEELRSTLQIKPGEQVFIAGSTQAPEEQFAIDAWQTLRDEHPELRLILVPRHKERFEEVAALITTQNLPLLRRSQLQVDQTLPSNDERPVLLLDTLGELSACWGLADFAFVGGSMGNRGGQNMIEPCAYGAAVCFGPNTRNFRDVVESLLSLNAASVVHDQTELTAQLRVWLTDPDSARTQGAIAQEFVRSQTGASARTAALIAPLTQEQTRAA